MSLADQEEIGVQRADKEAAQVECEALRGQRDAAITALRALYEAMPTGYGNDRALEEALKAAEKILREVQP